MVSCYDKYFIGPITSHRVALMRHFHRVRLATAPATVLGHSDVHRDTPGHSDLHRDTPGHSDLHRDTPGHSDLHRDTPGHSDVRRDTPALSPLWYPRPDVTAASARRNAQPLLSGEGQADSSGGVGGDRECKAEAEEDEPITTAADQLPPVPTGAAVDGSINSSDYSPPAGAASSSTHGAVYMCAPLLSSPPPSSPATEGVDEWEMDFLGACRPCAVFSLTAASLTWWDVCVYRLCVATVCAWYVCVCTVCAWYVCVCTVCAMCVDGCKVCAYVRSFVYVCMYVCMFGIYVCMCGTYVCMNECTFVCMYE